MEQSRKNSYAVVVMGVCGCGKSSFGQSLSKTIGAEFIEGDQLHPQSNIDKMSRGDALDDEDRQPWLEIIVSKASERMAQGRPVVIACSALKMKYRDILRKLGTSIWFAHLTGDRETILQRMQERHGHFMPATLLDSQLATLEVTYVEADVVELNLAQSIDCNIQTFLNTMRSTR